MRAWFVLLVCLCYVMCGVVYVHEAYAYASRMYIIGGGGGGGLWLLPLLLAPGDDGGCCCWGVVFGMTIRVSQPSGFRVDVNTHVYIPTYTYIYIYVRTWSGRPGVEEDEAGGGVRFEELLGQESLW